MKGGIFGYGECKACLWRRVGVGSCLYEIDHCTALGLCSTRHMTPINLLMEGGVYEWKFWDWNQVIQSILHVPSLR